MTCGCLGMHPAPDLPEPRHALVVAAATYTDAAFRHLRAPAQDATDIVDVLADPAVGGFAVTPVLDRPEYEIRRMVGTFLSDRNVDDLVLIYLSCHGVLDARGRLYFATTDTVKTQLSSTAVESTWLLDQMEDCRARRQVLILDCCFSGAFAHTKSGDELDLQRRLIGAGRGRAVLTASRAGEYSYEGTALADQPTRSVFTAALVEGLRSGEADHDGDGYISVQDAYAYAADRVKAAGSAQSPQRWLYGAEGEIILARSPRGMALTPAELPEALQLHLDSQYPHVRRGAVATLGAWLTSTNPREVLAAQQALQRVATEDSPAVADAARALLHATPSPTSVEQSPWSRELMRRRIMLGEKEIPVRILGQQAALAKTFDILKRAAFGLSRGQPSGSASRPRSVLFFAGPTGVGKTELAKQLARTLFDDPEAYLRFDMSDFAASHSADRLIGTSPGHVGHEAGGGLAGAVRRKPFSVVLFDEIEKLTRRFWTSSCRSWMTAGSPTDRASPRISPSVC